MIGYGNNKGIVPILCVEIFNENKEPNLHIEIEVIILETSN